MSTEIWVAVIGTIGIIAVPTINHAAQLRKSRKAGVKSEDVQAQPAAPPDPAESWERLVQRLEGRICRLDERVEKVEQEIKAERDMKWAAIHYIRRLHDWIAERMPGHAPPPVPDELTVYVTIPSRKDPTP